MAITATIVVLTYNPKGEKLRMTLNSILAQRGVEFEIVVADDGSSEDWEPFLDAFFRENRFSRYRLVRSPKNRGTVLNCLAGVTESRGTYVKPLSPGDAFTGETVLADWVAALESSGAAASFSDAVYYVLRDGRYRAVAGRAHPQNVRPFRREQWEKARYRYLVYDDLILGAAALYRRETLEAYLRQIGGKVIYAEDAVFRLMAYDRVPVCYYPAEAVLYECDTGVSSAREEIWHQRRVADWNAGSQILLDRLTPGDPAAFARKLRPAGTLSEKGKKALALKGLVFYRLKIKFFPRRTRKALPEAFLRRITAPGGKTFNGD